MEDSDPDAIYRQLVERVIDGVDDGLMAPGEQTSTWVKPSKEICDLNSQY